MVALKAASVLLIAGTVVAEPLTTITPCSSCPSSVSVQPITVTSQYQTVSTCDPTTRCFRGFCHTKYPFNTYEYVSTVIPVMNGTSTAATTVTSTDQVVTVSKSRTTITSYPKFPRGEGFAGHGPEGHGPEGPWAGGEWPEWKWPGGHRGKPVIETIGQDYFVPYNEIGPLAVPGYEGSGLCTECGGEGDGALLQPLEVVECTASDGTTKCVEYPVTWVSVFAPSAVVTAPAECSTWFDAPSAGTYTFTFPQWAPARTVTEDGQTYTFDPQGYNVYATQYCPDGGIFEYVTTVYVTITQSVPWSTIPATTTSHVTVPDGWDPEPTGWVPWVPASTTTSPVTGPTDPVTWAPWVSEPTDPSTPIWSSNPYPVWSSKSTPVWSSNPTHVWSSTFPVWTTTTEYTTSTSSSAGSTTSTSVTSTSQTSTTTGPTTSTSSTTSSQTSTTATTTTNSIPAFTDVPASVPRVRIIAKPVNVKYHKRAVQYVAFESSSDAVLENDPNLASLFVFYEGYLFDASNGDYVGTESAVGTSPFEEFVVAPEYATPWSTPGGIVHFRNALFCVFADSSLFIVSTGAVPDGCTVVTLSLLGTVTTTTTSTSWSRTTTATMSTSSMDMDERDLKLDAVADPIAVNRRAVKGNGMLRKAQQ